LLRLVAGGAPLGRARLVTHWIFPQRIIAAFIKPLNVVAAKALIPNLQPCAESTERW